MTDRDSPVTPSIERYVADNREMLTDILRHSDNDFARACVWTMLDLGSDGPELEQLRHELDLLEEWRST